MSNSSETGPRVSGGLGLGLYSVALAIVGFLFSIATNSGIILFLTVLTVTITSVRAIVRSVRGWNRAIYPGRSGAVLGGTTLGILGLVGAGYLMSLAADDVQERADRIH
jgi:hypothetical protein